MDTCVILGTDLRFECLASLLQEEGCTVLTQPLADRPATYFLPINASDTDLCALLPRIAKGSLIVTGKASDETRALCHQKKITLFLLLENETYRKQNALATAEGTLWEAIARTPRTLAGRTALVLGYGACGSAIAHLFFSARVRTFVYSHENSLLRAEKAGFLPCRILEKEAPLFDLVINTIPHPALPDAFFAGLKKGCLFLQVASGLSDISPARLDAQGVIFVPLPGLPARIAPQTEAETIDFLTMPYRKESDPF